MLLELGRVSYSDENLNVFCSNNTIDWRQKTVYTLYSYHILFLPLLQTNHKQRQSLTIGIDNMSFIISPWKNDE